MKKTFLFYVAVWLIPCLGQTQSPAIASPQSQVVKDKIYKYWDVPPLFAGCEELPGKKEKSKCSHDKLEQFLKDNVQNPGSFVKGGIRCYADASYVVEIDGTISNIKIINEGGKGVGDELLRLMSILPPMQPGKLDSVPIRCFQWISFHIDPEGEVSLSNEIFKVVEDPPVFPGCEQIKNKGERKKCSSDRVTEYISKNIAYPSLAVENGVEGMIIVSFIIEMDGSISYSEVVRDVGAGLGDEALRLVRSMPDWSPGKLRGRPVRVQYNLPVKFSLDNKPGNANKPKKD